MAQMKALFTGFRLPCRLSLCSKYSLRYGRQSSVLGGQGLETRAQTRQEKVSRGPFRAGNMSSTSGEAYTNQTMLYCCHRRPGVGAKLNLFNVHNPPGSIYTPACLQTCGDKPIYVFNRKE